MFPAIVKHAQRPLIPPESQYSMTFPFTDLNVEDQRIKSCNFECVLFCRELSQQPCAYMDELLNVFSMLERSRHISLQRLFFVDCLSSAGTASMLAFASRFGKVMGIEVSDDSKEEAEQCLVEVRKSFPDNSAACDLSFKVGSFLDYMPVDVDVIFLDGTLLSDNAGILDEVSVARSLLDLSRRLLKPVTLIFVTTFMNLDQTALSRLGYSHVSCIYQRRKQHAKDYNLWMLQVSK